MDLKALSLLVILGFVVIYFSVYLAYAFFCFVLPMCFYGAFFAKTDDISVENMIKLVEIKSGDVAVDLGSGDGKLVIAMAKAGAVAYGFEINPFLVCLSRINIKRAGLDKKAFMLQRNFWKEDLSKFDIVTIFGIKFIMEDLEVKLKKELKSGTKVISKYFIFPNWELSEKLGQVNLYIK